jgi:hypothetical protein
MAFYFFFQRLLLKCQFLKHFFPLIIGVLSSASQGVLQQHSILEIRHHNPVGSIGMSVQNLPHILGHNLTSQEMTHRFGHMPQNGPMPSMGQLHSHAPGKAGNAFGTKAN